MQDPEGDNYAHSKTTHLSHPSHNEDVKTGTFRQVKKCIKLISELAFEISMAV